MRLDNVCSDACFSLYSIVVSIFLFSVAVVVVVVFIAIFLVHSFVGSCRGASLPLSFYSFTVLCSFASIRPRANDRARAIVKIV